MAGEPRILFFTHYFPPEGNAPASRVHEMAKRWVRSGAKVTVVTCAPNVPAGKVYAGYKNRLRPQREQIDGIDVVRVWTYLAANKGTLRRMLNFVSYMCSAVFFTACMKRHDVIIATSPQFFCGWAGVLTKWIHRRPFLLEIRDIWPESIEVVGALKPGPALRTLEWLERRMYRAADHIVTVGKGYAEKIAEKSVSGQHITIVPNGVDEEIFPGTGEPDIELAKRLGVQDKFVCSYIGTVGICGGLGVMLKMAQELKRRGRHDVALLLVGDGAERADLAAETARLGLDNLHVLGRQPKQEIPGYLSISGCCLVHLQKNEFFKSVLPSKIFETAAMARPIVLGVEGNAAELVHAAGAGLCAEPENASELVDGVLRFADDPAFAAACGRSGRAHILEHYNRDGLAGQYMEVIRRARHKRGFEPAAV